MHKAEKIMCQSLVMVLDEPQLRLTSTVWRLGDRFGDGIALEVKWWMPVCQSPLMDESGGELPVVWVGDNGNKGMTAVSWERWRGVLHKGYDDTLNLSNEGVGASSVPRCKSS